MSCDKLVFDLSQEVEGSPNVFIRKDWLNILDNQNTNYQNNQSIIDTSQLANSNKYMAYREGYLSVPMVLSMSTPAGAGPATSASVINDYAIGLKNWYGSIIHSMTLDYNGTTIVQQTPFCNMWNSFKLLTTLSWNDILTQGPTIGFYPDTPDSFVYFPTAVPSGCGTGTCNNDMAMIDSSISTLAVNDYSIYSPIVTVKTPAVGAPVTGNVPMGGNYGLTIRTKWIAYPAYTLPLQQAASAAGGVMITPTGITSSPYTDLFSATNCNNMWKSYIYNKISAIGTTKGVIQYNIMATIYLKHIHSFFNMCPLLKGVFMKMTLNLNNCSVTVTTSGADNARVMTTSQPSASYVGGICPIMVPSMQTGSYYLNTANFVAGDYTYDLVVGAQVYNSTIKSAGGIDGKLSKSVYMYIPAYTFNPTFEQAYLSNNIKQIKYTDIYQYQVKNVDANQPFNSLITNGIANIKSVLIIPFFAKKDDGTSISTWASPFDPAGAGCTSPLVGLGNFNVQISGQNAIYNMQRYSFEEWNNQLYGQNAVNGGLTDGLTSGLIDFEGFQTSYCYYYVNVERMLPVEQSVPKSVQIIGTNYSSKDLNLWVFIEYGVQVSIDVLTGARV